MQRVDTTDDMRRVDKYSGLPGSLYDELTCVNPYQTRSASQGHTGLGIDSKYTNTFKYRASVFYNSVPSEVKKGSIPAAKKKLKQWILKNIPLDWG